MTNVQRLSEQERERTHPCLILGCGGHGRVVLDILLNTGCHEVVGFVDSNPDMRGRRVDGIEVLGSPDDLPRIRDELEVSRALIAVGDNGARRGLADRLDVLGFEPKGSFGGEVQTMWYSLERGADYSQPHYYNIRWLELLCDMRDRLAAMGGDAL